MKISKNGIKDRYDFNLNYNPTLARLDKLVEIYSKRIEEFESVINAKSDEELWNAIISNFDIIAFENLLTDCKLLNILSIDIATPYTYSNTFDDYYCSPSVNGKVRDRWFVYSLDDTFKGGYCTDEEIRSLFENEKLVLLTRYFETGTDKQCNYYISSPSFDVKKYKWYNSNIIMSKIKDYVLNNEEFKDSFRKYLEENLELLRFRLLEVLFLSKKIIKENHLDIKIENSIEMKLRKTDY